MAKSKFTKEQYLKWYEELLLMRRFEERAGQLYGMQKIKGFCHLYIGQEAVVAGAMSVLQPDDNMITAYRDHAHALGKGTSARAVMAELYGKATGCSKGKGGSMHMFDAKNRFFGGHGIVGGQIPLGAGIAFAEKYLGTKNVTVCYMGDGATRQGALHEAFNIAMTKKPSKCHKKILTILYIYVLVLIPFARSYNKVAEFVRKLPSLGPPRFRKAVENAEMRSPGPKF